MFGVGIFLRAERTAVVVCSVAVDSTRHLILLVKCVVIKIIIGFFFFFEWPCVWSLTLFPSVRCCYFQLLLSPMILGGKGLFLKAFFLASLLFTLIFR